MEGLDAARGFSILIGVFGHAVLAYTSVPSLWPVVDRSRSAAASLAFFAFYLFRLQAFFLMSGFFARLLYVRRGAATFTRNRAKRILLPFVVALIPVSVVNFLIERLISGPKPIESMRVEPSHLWFLYYLAMLLAVALFAVRWGGPAQGALTRADALIRRWIDSPIMPVALALVTAPILLGTYGIVTPLGFVPNLRLLLYWGVFFQFGWLVHRQQDVLARLALKVGMRLGIAAVAMVAIVAVLSTGSASVASFGVLVLRGIFTWFMAFAFIGFFLKYFSRPGRMSRRVVGYMADASYWTYLVHIPFVVLMQYALERYPWHWVPKLTLVMAVTLLICLVSYHYLVRPTRLGSVLSGRRIRRE